MKKRAAMELSVGTIVIIVLAMSMLILGLVLVKNIFEGSQYNIDVLNKGVKDEIINLFPKDDKVYVHLPNKIAEINQGDEWGVGFAIKNTDKGTQQDSMFEYEIVAADPDIQRKCGIGASMAESWVVAGRASRIPISPGDDYVGIARFQVPEDSPLCVVRYNIEVKKTGQAYAVDFFDLSIE